MRDTTELEKAQIVETRLAGASVTGTAELRGFLRVAISSTMMEFKKH